MASQSWILIFRLLAISSTCSSNQVVCSGAQGLFDSGDCVNGTCCTGTEVSASCASSGAVFMELATEGFRLSDPPRECIQASVLVLNEVGLCAACSAWVDMDLGFSPRAIP